MKNGNGIFGSGQLVDHLIVIAGIMFLVVPLWMIFASSTHLPEVLIRDGLQFFPGEHFLETYGSVLTERRGFTKEVTASRMIMNSMILGLGFAIGKILVSMTAAYAIVYFRFPLAGFLFWVIFFTLLLPLEVRIIPSYQVAAQLGLLNTYTGLILPLIASATGTFFFSAVLPLGA